MKNKENSLFFTLFSQFIICLILFVLLYTFKSSNQDIFSEIKTMFYDNLNENIIFSEEKDDDVTSNKSSTKHISETQNKDNIIQDTSKEAVKNVEFLSAKINNKKGDDNTPSNVSVASYTLNQKIVKPVKDGVITSKFGLRVHPVYNEERFHAGIDIAAAENTPIHASFSGVVKVASYDQWNGYYIKLLHEGDIMTVYCHCNKLAVKEGDFVDAGQIIAYVGSTGVSTGPHLHYELRVKDVSYDPEIALEVSADAV